MNYRKILTLILALGLGVSGLSLTQSSLVYAEPDVSVEAEEEEEEEDPGPTPEEIVASTMSEVKVESQETEDGFIVIPIPTMTIDAETGEARPLTEEEQETELNMAYLKAAQEEARLLEERLKREAWERETKAAVEAELSVIPEDNETVNIYRVCKEDTDEHLYTPDRNEVVELSIHGFRFEGLAWKAPKKGNPVYRLFNPNPNGYHMYTTDYNEVQTLMTVHGWLLDNNGNAMFYSGGDYYVPRLYNKEKKLHVLSADGNESRILSSNGWWEEDSNIYAVALPGQEEVPPMEIIKKGNMTIDKSEAQYAIEGDMTLKGMGTGYHSKFVICTATSAVSFGIQFDKYAQSPYGNRASFIVENIYSNEDGGQHYTRYGEAKIGEKYHLLLTMDKDGTAKCYIDGDLIAQVVNPELAYAPKMYLRCEGSARLNGDYVEAEFAKVKVLTDGRYIPGKTWEIYEFESNAGIVADFKDHTGGVISGTIQGFADGSDWDSEFEVSSGIVQYVK